PRPQARGCARHRAWVRGRVPRHDLQSLRPGRSFARRIGSAHGPVPVTGGAAGGDARALRAAARARALGRLDAGGARGLGAERGPGDRAARRARGHHGRRAAYRPAALRGTGAPLDAAVHLDAEGRRAAAGDPERRYVLPGTRAAPRARVRVRRGPRGEAGAARDAHAPRHHPGHRARAHRPHPVPRQPGARHDQPREPAMNEILRDRLVRKLDALPDDKAYQVLDYVEFLESKYAERAAGAPPFQRVAETLEDTLRAGRVPVNIIKGTMDAVAKAEMAIAIAREGGIGVIHKNMPVDRQAAEVDRVKRSESGMILHPITLGPDRPLREAVRLMDRFRISGVPIVDDAGRLV